MRKLLFIIILIHSYLFNIHLKFIPFEDNHDWNYAYSYAIMFNTDEIACRMADVLTEYAYKNKLDVEILTRQKWKESKFKRRAISYLPKIEKEIKTNYLSNSIIVSTNYKKKRVPIGYGISQINLSQHDVRLYYILDKKYAKRLHEDSNFKYQMIFFIEVNIALGTEILREELDRFNNNYSLALTAYWAGPNSDQLKLLKNSNICNHYINDILDKGGYEEKMRKYNNWVFTNRKKNLYSSEFKKRKNHEI